MKHRHRLIFDREKEIGNELVLIYKCSKCGKTVKKTKQEMQIEEKLKLTYEERMHNLIDLIETLMKANAGVATEKSKTFPSIVRNCEAIPGD